VRARARRLGVGLALAGGLALLPTCTSLVRPPADPRDPQAVFLLSIARHRGLVLPAPDGGWVEYAYGDHDWYARLRNRWYHAFDTVLWPTRATLGRRTLPSDGAGRPATSGAVRLDRLEAPGARVRALARDLEARFEARRDERIHNAAYGLDFVPAEPGFWAFHNCTDAVAGWLERLGCEVSWALVRVDIALEPSGAGPQPSSSPR